MISSLIDAVLHFELLNSKDDFQQPTGEIVSAGKIHTFQETVGTPFLAFVKKNISSRHDIVSALAIFDPCNIPILILPNFPLMERSQLRFYSTTTGQRGFLSQRWLSFRNVGYNIPKLAKDSHNWFDIVCFNSFY